ncbi:MAG: hypothetical protein ABIQ64_01830 [Candidatus Saccharimonadales bacterium]
MKHYILAAVVLHIFSLLLLLKMRGFNTDETFSQKAAKSNLSAVLYSLSFIVPFVFLYLFFTNWFIPQFNLSGLFYLFLVIALGFQILCTFFPERGGWLTFLHQTLTGISAISLLPLLILIVLSNTVNVPGRILSTIAILWMVYLLYIGLRNLQGHAKALWLQIGYYVLFFASIVAVTYL